MKNINKWLVFLVIILSILILVLVGYIFYEKELNINNNTENTQDNNSNNTGTNNGEKLVQFDTRFYSLKDIAKEYSVSADIKKYKDFNYDLDGDNKTDKITLSYEEGTYVIKLNGKKIEESEFYAEIYIVDLNEKDNKLEVVLFDEGPSDDPSYVIYSKVGNNLKEVYGREGDIFKCDKKGLVLIDHYISGNFIPNIYFDYIYIENSKVENKYIDINKIKNIDIRNTRWYFSKDYSNKDKVWAVIEGNINRLSEINIEQLDENTTFNILGVDYITKEDIGTDYKVYVELSDGRKGYVFYIQWAG